MPKEIVKILIGYVNKSRTNGGEIFIYQKC